MLAYDQDGFVSSYCNTVPTPQGGSHEAGSELLSHAVCGPMAR